MQYTLRKASDYQNATTIEIETLQDLQALQEQYGHELIVDFDEKDIVIYDDYLY